MNCISFNCFLPSSFCCGFNLSYAHNITSNIAASFASLIIFNKNTRADANALNTILLSRFLLSDTPVEDESVCISGEPIPSVSINITSVSFVIISQQFNPFVVRPADTRASIPNNLLNNVLLPLDCGPATAIHATLLLSLSVT